MIVIGSTAIKHWLPDFREPKDVDVMSSSRTDEYDSIVVPKEIREQIPHVNFIATLDAVYTIKLSHLPYDLKWQKHKQDVLYLKAKGCQIVEPLYSLLCEHWKQEHKNKPYLSLYKKKTDFFDDFITKVYEHDYLHELIAHPNKPVYTQCLKDGEEVAIDKAKFDALPREQQLLMFAEEIAVISIERWLVNPKCCGKYTWVEAYFLALHKTITALTKGWASQFIVENIEFYNRPNYELFKRALQTLKEGEKIMGKRLTSANVAVLLEEIALAYNASEDDKDSWFDLEDLDTSTLWAEIVFAGNTVELLEQYGGEDCGGNYYAVFKFNGKTYKASTWYASHYGVEWSAMEVYEVEAKQKTITVYE